MPQGLSAQSPVLKDVTESLLAWLGDGRLSQVRVLCSHHFDDRKPAVHCIADLGLDFSERFCRN